MCRCRVSGTARLLRGAALAAFLVLLGVSAVVRATSALSRWTGGIDRYRTGAAVAVARRRRVFA